MIGSWSPPVFVTTRVVSTKSSRGFGGLDRSAAGRRLRDADELSAGSARAPRDRLLDDAVDHQAGEEVGAHAEGVGALGRDLDDLGAGRVDEDAARGDADVVAAALEVGRERDLYSNRGAGDQGEERDEDDSAPETPEVAEDRDGCPSSPRLTRSQPGLLLARRARSEIPESVQVRRGSAPLIGVMDRAINLTFHGIGDADRAARRRRGRRLGRPRAASCAVLDTVSRPRRRAHHVRRRQRVGPRARAARAARARADGDVLRGRRPRSARPASSTPRTSRALAAAGHDDRLPRHAPPRLARPRRRRAARGAGGRQGDLERVVETPGDRGRVPVRLLRPPGAAARCAASGYAHVLHERPRHRPARRVPAGPQQRSAPTTTPTLLERIAALEPRRHRAAPGARSWR